MPDGILSQEEIDALLRGETAFQQEREPQPVLTDMEKDVLGEIGNISMGTAATTLSTLLRRKVSITTPQVKLTSKQQLQTDYPLPYLLIEVEYTDGLSGSNILVVKKEDASVIADLMMGGDGSRRGQELGEIELSAVSEAMNQMMGSATTSLSSMFDRRIEIAPPRLILVDLGKDSIESTLGQEYKDIVQILFRMEIEGLVDSEIMQIMPLEAAKNMVATLMGGVAESEDVAVSPPAAQSPASQVGTTVGGDVREIQMSPAPPPISMPSVSNVEMPARGFVLESEGMAETKKAKVAVQPVQFAPLVPETHYVETQNISLILDVPLNVSVELGRTRKTIKEILELGPGSIIQLEKLAGEPVDILVNGKLIAKGEVVVIDENYGVRVTAIISPMDRVSKLQ